MAELTIEHRCHAVLLYGSRARGDATKHSDYDIMGVRKSGQPYRLARKQDGFYVDGFIYPEKDLKKVAENFLHMNQARLLVDKNGFGAAFLKKLKVARKHKPSTPNDINVSKVWLHKMFERTLLNDIEGNYRRSWLHEALLTEYFNIRKKRYLGSKQSFAWLKQHDAPTYRLFDRVLARPLDHKILKKLVERVSGIKLS